MQALGEFATGMLVGLGSFGIALIMAVTIFSERSPKSPKSNLTMADLKEFFPQIAHAQGTSTDEVWREAVEILAHHGITTITQLQAFVLDDDVFEMVSEMYVELLGRIDANNLDPLAVAGWGGRLHQCRCEIAKKIMASEEYKAKHQKKQ